MPINNITQTISELPAAGRRGVDVQSIFVTKQEDFQDHLQGTTVTELNTLKDQLNSRIGEINSTTTTMNDYASIASTGASTATTKAGEASTSASGALTSKNQASTFATNSSNSATKSSQWADNDYNVAVETGRYSAKHWSVVAENATSGKIDKVTSTDNAIVRFDGTSGAVQNSVVTIGASGEISTPGEISTNTQLVIGSGGDNRRGAIYSDDNWGMFFRAKIDTPLQAPFVWMRGDGGELFRHNGTALTTNITGNSATATKLATTRTINGVAFDGSTNITAPTDLGITAGATAGPIVTSSTGTNATLPTASATASGVVTTGNQTIAGVKTFSSSPIVPTPTTNTQAVNKQYADLKVALADFTGTNVGSGTNGYQKLPNGLIIQWGTSPNISIANSYELITSPISFPTECLFACGSSVSLNSYGGAGKTGTNSVSVWGNNVGVAINYIAVGY